MVFTVRTTAGDDVVLAGSAGIIVHAEWLTPIVDDLPLP